MTIKEQIQEILDSQAFRDEQAFTFWIAYYRRRAENPNDDLDRQFSSNRACELESLLAKIDDLRKTEKLQQAIIELASKTKSLVFNDPNLGKALAYRDNGV